MDSLRMVLVLVIYLKNTVDCQFTNPSTEVQGCEHSDVRMSWQITDYETVKFVTWNKGANTIMSQVGSNNATSIDDNIKHGGNGAIIIEAVQSVDAGEYVCVVTSASDYVYSSTATLNIIVAPSYSPRLNSTVKGSNINHTCVVDTKGNPEVDITIKIGAVEKSGDTFTVQCDNIEDISCCFTGTAVSCLSLENNNKTCVKIEGLSGCILNKSGIAVLVLSIVFILMMIFLLIWIFRKNQDSRDNTWVRIAIGVAVVDVINDVTVLVVAAYILNWCSNCIKECTADRCSDTWREVMLIVCSCDLGILYKVIIILTIIWYYKWSGKTNEFEYSRLLDEVPSFSRAITAKRKEYQYDVYTISKRVNFNQKENILDLLALAPAVQVGLIGKQH